MSARTKKVGPLDRLVTKRDLWKVIAAMNEATRALESRIEDLENRGREPQPVDGCELCGSGPNGATYVCGEHAEAQR